MHIAPVFDDFSHNCFSPYKESSTRRLALVARPIPAEVAECFHLGTGHQRLDQPRAGLAPLPYIVARN